MATMQITHLNLPTGNSAGKPITSTLEGWANMYVPIGTGLQMLTAQAANEVLRHCRIGRVTKKAAR